MLMGGCGETRMYARSMASTLPQMIDARLAGSFAATGPASPNGTVYSTDSDTSNSSAQLHMFFNEMMMQSVNPARPSGFNHRTATSNSNYMDSYARYSCAEQFRMGYQSLLSPPVQTIPFEFVPGLYPGMREIPGWLKGLRLHKYTTMFQCLTYEQMMNLGDYILDAFQVTQGARKKILQSIDKLKLRPLIIRAMFKDLCTGQCVRCVILNVRYMLNTPIKPYVPRYHEAMDYAEGHVSIDYINDENIPALLVCIVQRLHALIFQSRSVRVEEDYLLLMYAIFDRITNNEAFSEYQKRRVGQMKKTARRFATPQELRKHRGTAALAHGGRCDPCQQRGVGSEWTKVFFPQRQPQPENGNQKQEKVQQDQPSAWETQQMQQLNLVLIQRHQEALANQKAYVAALAASAQNQARQHQQQNYQPASMQNLGTKLRQTAPAPAEVRRPEMARMPRAAVNPTVPMATEPVLSHLPQYQSAQTTAAVAAAAASSVTCTTAPSFRARMEQVVPSVEKTPLSSSRTANSVSNSMSVQGASDWSHFTHSSLFGGETIECIRGIWSTPPTRSNDCSLSGYSSASGSVSERSSGSVSPDASLTARDHPLSLGLNETDASTMNNMDTDLSISQLLSGIVLH